MMGTGDQPIELSSQSSEVHLRVAVMSRSRIPSDFAEPIGAESYAPTSSLWPEVRARGTILMAFREAAHDLWGEDGEREIGKRLPDVVRAETLDLAAVNLAWVPEAYVLSWYDALWHGPCDKQREVFARFLCRMMDNGFGRVRKAFLAFAKPAMILSKAPTFWRHDHSHGELTVEALEADSAKVKLSDHPYTRTSLGCLATAEIYRYCVTLCRAKHVTEIHYRDPSGALVVRLRWQP